MLARTAFVSSLLVAITAAAETEDIRTARGRYKHPDPFSLLDRHMSVALSHDSVLPHLATPYFWPWAELAKAAVAIEEDDIEEPVVRADSDKYQVQLEVRHFQPHEIKVKVRGKTLFVEGKRLITDGKTNKSYVANHFIQRYMLPAGVVPEEITAELKLTGVLYISAPMHEVKPVVKEREIPLVIEKAPEKENNPRPTEGKIEETVTEKKEIDEKKIQEDSKTLESQLSDKSVESDDRPSDQIRIKHLAHSKGYTQTSSTTEKLTTDSQTLVPELAETTVLVSKTRKKELKNETIEQKKNETKKSGENNELDYVIESIE